MSVYSCVHLRESASMRQWGWVHVRRQLCVSLSAYFCKPSCCSLFSSASALTISSCRYSRVFSRFSSRSASSDLPEFLRCAICELMVESITPSHKHKHSSTY